MPGVIVRPWKLAIFVFDRFQKHDKWGIRFNNGAFHRWGVLYANKTDNRQKPLCKSYINVIHDVNFSLQWSRLSVACYLEYYCSLPKQDKLFLVSWHINHNFTCVISTYTHQFVWYNVSFIDFVDVIDVDVIWSVHNCQVVAVVSPYRPMLQWHWLINNHTQAVTQTSIAVDSLPSVQMLLK